MIEAQGDDFSVNFIGPTMDEDAKLFLKCKECKWRVDLNRLDTLEDIVEELRYHRENCNEGIRPKQTDATGNGGADS